MKTVDTDNLMKAIDEAAGELHEKVNVQHALIRCALGQQLGDDELKKLVLPSLSDDSELKEALKEAIEVLEESRKSFKSRKLEVLRKKLTDALIESK